jgi:hypothetical protein
VRVKRNSEGVVLHVDGGLVNINQGGKIDSGCSDIVTGNITDWMNNSRIA